MHAFFRGWRTLFCLWRTFKKDVKFKKSIEKSKASYCHKVAFFVFFRYL